MKKFYFSSLMLLMISFHLLAQNITITIQGYVTDLNGAAVANHDVYIVSDSSFMGTIFFYNNTVQTNGNGYFVDYVSVPSNAQILFNISTIDCNGLMHTVTGVSTNAPINATFSICTGPMTLCQASFMAIPDSMNPAGSLAYYFYDLSTGNITQWHWDFGDGTSSTQQNPYHVYAQPGTYTVCLTVTGPNCQDTYCLTVTVGIFNCYASFQAYPDSSGYAYYFVDNSMGNPITWLWDFGDGSTSTIQNPYHAYNAMGTYTVCLTITTASGCTDTFCSVVTVGPPPACQAYWGAWPDSSSNLSWYFYDLSTGNPTNWIWSFGDGTTGTGPFINHTYASPGVYVVCLTITGPNCQDTYCDSLFVSSGPACSSYFTYTISGSTCAFQPYANGVAPFSYFWDFGDGGTSSLLNPVHTYNQPGGYVVTLTVTDANGCASTSTGWVWIQGSNVNLWGQVHVNNTWLDHGYVVLYTTNPAGTFSVLDTTVVDSSGLYLFYNIPQGTYYLKAFPTPNSAFFNTHLPTYYQSSLFWAGATPIILGQPSNPYDITLLPVISPSAGPGNITGNLSTGNKFFVNGVPVPNAEILLLNMGNQPLLLDYTDNQGNFGFSGLAYGTYKIYAEIAGLPCTPALVTLSGSNPNASNTNLVVTTGGITTGISEPGNPDEGDELAIYPNPARDKVSVSINTDKPGMVSLSLKNILGGEVYNEILSLDAGLNTIQMTTADFKAGIYSLTITGNGVKATQKLSLVK